MDEMHLQHFLVRLAASLTKVFVNTRAAENLPAMLTQSLEEVESFLTKEGPHEVKIIVALGRLGGAASPSHLEQETSLTPEEVYEAILSLYSAGIVSEVFPGIFQLVAMRAMKASTSQWGTLATVSEIFHYCKSLIESTNDPVHIARALDALRDTLITKGGSGVVIAEIAKEARMWGTGSGDKDKLLNLLSGWEERAPL